jgi:C-terminal processing protease CtpA/Prc
MKLCITSLFFFFIMPCVLAQTKYQVDFSFYWQTINDNFAYFDQRKTNWDKVKIIYQPVADTIKTDSAFIHLLEKINNELYNGHVFLNRNTLSSNRTIPTGADIKAVFKNNHFVISEIREGYNADLCGLKKGMVILEFNDMPVNQAIREFLPQSFLQYDNAIYEYAINMLLAGKHNVKRKITVSIDGKERSFFPDHVPNKTEQSPKALLDQELRPGNIGYIKINNSLGDSALIKAFDDALDSLINTKELILDLRETPSGGNTTVARAIMGRFIDKELPYQKHIYTIEEKETGIKRSTLELVSPRAKMYKQPLKILVSYWTGSMAEGIAIGFDGMQRGKVAGTKMAGLLGEIYSFVTPNLKIPFSVPSVKLAHVNGQPREDFIPAF